MLPDLPHYRYHILKSLFSLSQCVPEHSLSISILKDFRCKFTASLQRNKALKSSKIVKVNPQGNANYHPFLLLALTFMKVSVLKRCPSYGMSVLRGFTVPQNRGENYELDTAIFGIIVLLFQLLPCVHRVKCLFTFEKPMHCTAVNFKP